MSGLVGNSRRHDLSCRGSYVFILLRGNNKIDSCTPDGVFKELRDIVLELQMSYLIKSFALDQTHFILFAPA